MIAVVQRVTYASVSVDGSCVATIDEGLHVLLGVLDGDSEEDMRKLLEKLVYLRIFADDAGKMNRSVTDVGGAMLVVSQFTLAANVKKGRRPSFDRAADPEAAKALYEAFVTLAREHLPVETGVFGANMALEIHNDGPVTIIIDSSQL
jgi:D-aminoacyl-tRNA deacylase